MTPSSIKEISAAIERMTVSEAQGFLKSFLVGQSILDGAAWDEPPFAVVRRLYSQLPSLARQVLMDAILQSLQEVVGAVESPAQEAAAENLLLVAAHVFQSAADDIRQAAIDQVLRIAAVAASLAIQDRALSLLPSLGYRGTPRFWKTIALERGQDRARIAARGLAEIDPGLAFAWAIEPGASPARLTAMAELLPWLGDEHGGVAVGRWLAGVWTAIAKPAREEIKEWARPLGVRMPVSDPVKKLHRRMKSWDPDWLTTRTVALLKACVDHCEPEDDKFERLVVRIAEQVLTKGTNERLLSSSAFCQIFLEAAATFVAIRVIVAAVLQVEVRVYDPAKSLLRLSSRGLAEKGET